MLRFAWLGLWLLLASPVHAQDANGANRGDLPFTAHRYELTARLDPAKKQVQGAARITFTNTSPRPLEALLFHLYLNAFRDDDSVFMTESGGALRGQHAQGHGRIEVQSLVIAGRDGLPRAERELVPKDFTQLRVPLEAPLEPGATLVIELRFLSTLPPVFARSGYAGDFFAVGQWFPKLAKLDADGFVGFPYHALGEFYSDFADYSLEVDAPSDYAVVASGDLVDDTPLQARTRHRFRADCVHDVAFVAARDFQLDLESVDGVLVRYLSPPGFEDALTQHAEVVRAGLRRLGEQFGKYPYGTLSVVIPPRNAPGAAGMEYPTLITTGGSWMPFPGLPSLGGAVVTAHELAHQWFYGLLASDELHHPVLDEGLTEWASLDLMRTIYGAREGVGSVTFDRYEIERALAVRASGIGAGMAANEYESNEYATSIYARASAALESIRRAHGVARFERALSFYARRNRFKHPTPADLESAFDAVYGAGFAASVL
ncbi:MAG TPA: M1 family metallopeptidase, partial [Polyangiales bacterium]|nr:M1 family metallopeptidase [Polyangiales bacterium]